MGDAKFPSVFMTDALPVALSLGPLVAQSAREGRTEE